MHSDRKIGFAMGILLIGIVAALFFRNEPLLSTKVPGIRREEELNQRLRERNAAVYLNDSKSEDSVEPTEPDQQWTLRDVLQKMDERNKTAPVPVGSRSFAAQQADEIPNEELDGYRPKKRRTGERSGSASAESPLKLSEGNVEQTQSGIKHEALGKLPPLMPTELMPAASKPSEVADAPTQLSDLAAGSKDQPKATEPTFDFQPPENFEEYVVKYGDTLSGIAQRTLGSPNKYSEIYNANRDRMASPDRLTVGKPLRIPRTSDSQRTANERLNSNGNPSL
jgi:LysM repeat protein